MILNCERVHSKIPKFFVERVFCTIDGPAHIQTTLFPPRSCQRFRFYGNGPFTFSILIWRHFTLVGQSIDTTVKFGDESHPQNTMIAATVVSDIPDVLSRTLVELGYPCDVCKATNTTFILLAKFTYGTVKPSNLTNF